MAYLKQELGSSLVSVAPSRAVAARVPEAEGPSPVGFKAPDALIEFRARLGLIDPALFNMAVPAASCGTPACFCGWGRTFFFDSRHVAREEVATRLGLLPGQAASLFRMPIDGHRPCDTRDNVNPYGANLADGLRVLDHLIATGDVRWDLAKAEGRS